MTFARIGTGSGKVLLDSSADPAVVTGLPSSTAGSLVVCLFSFHGGTVNITSATSNAGGTWVIFQSAISAGVNRAGFAYCLNAPAGITQVSLTGSAGSPYGVASIEEFSYAGTCSVDQTNSATGSSTPTPLSTGNITNSTATDVMFGCVGSDDSGTAAFTIGGSGTWTSSHNEGDTTLHHASVGAFQIAASTGPHNMTGSYAGEIDVAAAAIISFQEAGGGGTALAESEWHPTEPQTNPLTVSVW